MYLNIISTSAKSTNVKECSTKPIKTSPTQWVAPV